MSDLFERLSELQREAEEALAAASDKEAIRAWHGEYLGRKGRLPAVLRGLGELAPEERPRAGQAVNRAKGALEAAFEARQERIEEAAIEERLRAETVDVTLPGRPVSLGRLHPSTLTLREIYRIFGQMGFSVFDSPEVETDELNFGLLNIPEGHPARDMWDTFYTTTPGLILRTHTSPGQVYAMQRYAPGPLRIVLPGKCYRYEQVTARSEWMFNQVEGLAVGRRITFTDLKGVLFAFAEEMFGKGRQLRFRKSYFPFTEPSVEVDVSCLLCGGGGCQLCKYSGWLEILGAGMVHPRVLVNGGYDPAEHSGFAFGMGPERIAMLKHGITDIRYFFSNDVRFLDAMPH